MTITSHKTLFQHHPSSFLHNFRYFPLDLLFKFFSDSLPRIGLWNGLEWTFEFSTIKFLFLLLLPSYYNEVISDPPAPVEHFLATVSYNFSIVYFYFPLLVEICWDIYYFFKMFPLYFLLLVLISKHLCCGFHTMCWNTLLASNSEIHSSKPVNVKLFKSS